ncbi:MAG: hypothetical protein JOY54_09015 [Acidobacteriaceae bacterium]|nr:hypothetical protein [Acidobacteriaceae bacterium]
MKRIRVALALLLVSAVAVFGQGGKLVVTGHSTDEDAIYDLVYAEQTSSPAADQLKAVFNLFSVPGKKILFIVGSPSYFGLESDAATTLQLLGISNVDIMTLSTVASNPSLIQLQNYSAIGFGSGLGGLSNLPVPMQNVLSLASQVVIYLNAGGGFFHFGGGVQYKEYGAPWAVGVGGYPTGSSGFASTPANSAFNIPAYQAATSQTSEFVSHVTYFAAPGTAGKNGVVTDPRWQVIETYTGNANPPNSTSQTTVSTSQTAVSNVPITVGALNATIAPLVLQVTQNPSRYGDLTVAGVGFDSGSTATIVINGTTYSSLAGTIGPDGTTLEFQVPSAAFNGQDLQSVISVVSPTGGQSNPISFDLGVSPAPATPTLSGSSQSTVTTGVTGDVSLTLTGTGFVCNGLQVTLTEGGTSQTLPASRITSCSATQVVVDLPASAFTKSGTLNITVANPHGQPSSPIALTVVAPTFKVPTFSVMPVVSTNPTQYDISLNVTIAETNVAGYTGKLTLSFTPDGSVQGLPAGESYTDPALKFVQGDAGDTTGRTLSFTIPPCTAAPCTTNVSLPSNGAFSPGGVAGKISVTLASVAYQGDGTDVTSQICPAGAAACTAPVTVGAAVPVITQQPTIVLNPGGTGFTISLQGTTNTRELGNATYVFSAATGAKLNGANQFTATVSIGQVAQTQWFATPAALGTPGGGGFSLGVSFTYSGDPKALGNVTVTLSNSQGNSVASNPGTFQ